MPDKIKRQQRIANMSPIDIKLEKMETVNDFINIYKASIQNYLNEITTDSVLQSQIRDSMGLNN